MVGLCFLSESLVLNSASRQRKLVCSPYIPQDSDELAQEGTLDSYSVFFMAEVGMYLMSFTQEVVCTCSTHHPCLFCLPSDYASSLSQHN